MIEPAESSANLEDSGPRDPESLGKESQVREEKPVPTKEEAPLPTSGPTRETPNEEITKVPEKIRPQQPQAKSDEQIGPPQADNYAPTKEGTNEAPPVITPKVVETLAPVNELTNTAQKLFQERDKAIRMLARQSETKDERKAA